MSSNEINHNSEAKVTFARTLSVFDASMIGIGAMIGAGIFVLTGIAAGEAGPAALLAFALNGLITLFTALSYAELASAYPRSGGGYSYVAKAFPGATGFAAGWMLWFCYIIACSLYALGFGSYFWEFVRAYIPGFASWVFSVAGSHLPGLFMTCVVSAVFIIINMRGTAVTGKVENIITLAKIAILGVFILFGLRKIFGMPVEAVSSFKPFMPKGFGGVVIAMGLTFIAFEGYDLIATVAEEIKNPEKNIPLATFISLGVTLIIYLLVLFVCIGAIHPDSGKSWQFLGKYQETAIAMAAQEFMPAFGVALIIFGGLLSTISALNATILASSRVAFSMSRDKMLPDSLGKIHSVRRTPHIAIAVTGAIVITISLLFPINVIGSAASLMFLLTFTLVNFSLIVLRRKFPELKGGFRVPLYPFTPIAAIILNICLAVYQYKFDPRSWFIALAWITTGLFTYFVYFEKLQKGDMPEVLEINSPDRVSTYDYRIVIPLANPDNMTALMDFAIPIAKANNGEIIVLGVVDIPINIPVYEGMRFVHHKMPLLRKAIKYGKEQGVEVRHSVRITHRVWDGILQAAGSEKASLILMGWKGYTSTRDRILGEVTDKVVRYAPCDLIVVKLVDNLTVKKVLFPTAGGPHAMLAAKYLSCYCDAYSYTVDCCYVVKPDSSEIQKHNALEWINKTVQSTGLADKANAKLIQGNKVVSSIVRESIQYDMLVLGASNEGIFSNVLFGEIPEKIARFASSSSVMIVKKYEGRVKSLINKIFG